jgi:hypothetical protein
MLELGQNAEAAVRDLRQGRALLLTYRCRPLAHLEPIRPSVQDIAADDPLYTLAEQAGTAGTDDELAKENARLTSAEIDRALYGRRRAAAQTARASWWSGRAARRAQE